MVILHEVPLLEVRQHEKATGANVDLGGYNMDKHCPTNEFKCFRVKLEREDDGRVHLLGLTEFAVQTQSQSCRLRDILPSAAAIPRVASLISNGIDLRSRPGLELVLVGCELTSNFLVTIDGNHRAIAQRLQFLSIEGVSAFLCVHPSIKQWGFMPQLAR